MGGVYGEVAEVWGWGWGGVGGGLMIWRWWWWGRVLRDALSKWVLSLFMCFCSTHLF